MSHKFSFFFSYKIEKTETKKNVFYLIVFDPIKIDTHLAPKNVHQNINFVKDINLVCKKMTRNCHKIVPKPICALHFQYVFMKRKMRLHNNFDLFFFWHFLGFPSMCSIIFEEIYFFNVLCKKSLRRIHLLSMRGRIRKNDIACWSNNRPSNDSTQGA